MHKSFISRSLAAIAAAMAMMTAPVATTTAMSVATAVAPAVTSVAVAAVTLMPTDVQAGRRDPRYDLLVPDEEASSWDELLAWLYGLFMAED